MKWFKTLAMNREGNVAHRNETFCIWDTFIGQKQTAIVLTNSSENVVTFFYSSKFVCCNWRCNSAYKVWFDVGLWFVVVVLSIYIHLILIAFLFLALYKNKSNYNRTIVYKLDRLNELQPIDTKHQPIMPLLQANLICN